MLHKVRGLYGQSDETVLNGTVEMDEMYLGGRETNKHNPRRQKAHKDVLPRPRPLFLV